MIQQISPIPSQPGAQAPSNQPQAAEETFQSVMQKTNAAMTGGKGGKTVSAQQSPVKGKPSGQQSDPSNGQVQTANLSALAAMIQQFQQPQQQDVQVTAADPTVATAPVQNVEGVAPQAAGTTQPDSFASIPNSATTVPIAIPIASAPVSQNPVQAPAPSVAQAITPSALQTDSQTPAAVVLEQQAAGANISVPQIQTAAAELLPASQIANLPKPQQTQSQVAQQTSAPIRAESSIPAVRFTPAETSSDSNSNSFEAQSQEATALPVKQSTNADEAVYSNQTPLSFSDLMKTGNVIIKVSDAPEGTAKAAVHQVADKISLNYKAGNPKFEMDLYPKDLGKVTVKMAMENGTLTVEIAAANPKTQSMLLSDAGGIRSMIETTVNHPVQILEPSQDKQWYQQDQSQSQSQQQERQQKESSGYKINEDDANFGADDFLTVMQQLRVKAYSV